MGLRRRLSLKAVTRCSRETGLIQEITRLCSLSVFLSHPKNPVSLYSYLYIFVVLVVNRLQTPH
ncbi:hypothetical protein H5410_041369 [Solanum commersonii]|uniref:Uncharacterized protein n=1 Tax=Solanum commersonii TaxID=4109 RepID=A0A9J5XTF2_SOLCO|nr:hypothetical protein H5410_041369 [Solanum commersonii]